MARFRKSAEAVPEPLTLDGVRRLAAEVLALGHFFVGPSVDLALRHLEREEIPWEVFQGRLLDPAHTRARRALEAWSAYTAPSAEPLLSLKLDAAGQRMYVVRGLECYVHEGYDAGGGVFLTREIRKWVRELTGSIDLDRFADLGELRDEMISQLSHAVAGASRLPLHPVEAPLTGFSFGEIFYCYAGGAVRAEPVRDWATQLEGMFGSPLGPWERAKFLETFLHVVPANEMAEAATEFAARCSMPLAVMRTLFNEVSLSPWTDLVEKTLLFLAALERHGRVTGSAAIDFLSHLLRQTGRHLTAYDLVTFHYRGANYPDALLLDAVLKDFLGRCERQRDSFLDGDNDAPEDRGKKRRRRRALRQAWISRRKYEGHFVPDAPTSPGENARVLPPGHPRVPEEQILQSSRRTRRLYDNDPLPDPAAASFGEVLRAGVLDLAHPEELRELGLGLFIERPFGDGKAPVEPDSTPMLASLGFSKSLAVQRVRYLARDLGLMTTEFADDLCQRLERDPINGLPLDAIGPPPRAGSIGLIHARQVAADFVFLQTLRGSVVEFLAQFDLTSLGKTRDLTWLTGGRAVLFARSPDKPAVRIYDDQLRPQLELQVDSEGGFASRGGREFPTRGLLARWLGEDDGDAIFPGQPIRLPVR